jgi:predicted outer membrane protein
VSVRIVEFARVFALASIFSTPLVEAAELTEDDRAFVTKAEAACAGEIGMAGIALKRSVADPVKRLAQTIIDDCRKAGFELLALSDIDPAAAVLEPPQAQTQTRLQTIEQARFDQRYLAAVAADHQAMVALYAKAAQSLHMSRLREFALVTQARVQAHLDESKRLQQPAKPKPA